MFWQHWVPVGQLQEGVPVVDSSYSTVNIAPFPDSLELRNTFKEATTLNPIEPELLAPETADVTSKGSAGPGATKEVVPRALGLKEGLLSQTIVDSDQAELSTIWLTVNVIG